MKKKFKIKIIGNKKLGKRGVSHIEIILSFIIFVGFLLFLFAVIPVYNPVKSKVGLDAAEKGIVNLTSIEITYFTIALNQSMEECFYFESNVALENGKVKKIIVKNESEGRIKAESKRDKVYINDSGRFYSIYFSSEFDEDKLDTEECVNLTEYSERNLIDYEFGLIRRYEGLSYNKIKELNETYFSNYESLRAEFSMPKNENFGFIIREIKGEEILKVMKKRAERVEVLARDVPIQLVYANGTFKYVMLNIQVW